MPARSRWNNVVIGSAAIGPAFIGLASIALALYTFLDGDYIAAALSLLAGGMTFGLASIAMFGPSS